MAKYTPEFKEEVKQAYLNGSGSLATIAAQFGVGERTIEGWCKDGGWAALKTSEKVVSINKPKSQKSEVRSQPDQPPRDEVVRVNRRRRAGEIDELELVDIALSDVSAVMGSGEIDAKGIGSCASALCRLIELRLKLKPRSAAELAEMALNLGVNPAEFARELRQAWEKRA